MKKLMFGILLLAATAVHAEQNVYGDIFPYENRHSSFSFVINAHEYSRFSIQTVYSTQTISNATFGESGVSVIDNTIAVSTGYATALPVLLVNQGTAVPTPLVKGTTYYAIKVTDTLIQLATTYAQAVSGDEIDLLASSGGGWQINPLSLNLGTAHYLWEASNNGENWVTVGSSQALTALSSSEASRLHDFGEYAYRLLRFTFNGPSNGVIKLRAYFSGRK